mgnify:CR=1 FL=1
MRSSMFSAEQYSVCVDVYVDVYVCVCGGGGSHRQQLHNMQLPHI